MFKILIFISLLFFCMIDLTAKFIERFNKLNKFRNQRVN